MRQWHIMIDTGPEGWRHPAGWDGYTSREDAERALAKARALWAVAKLIETLPEDNVYAHYVTWGSVRGLGPVRTDRQRAERDLLDDQNGCRKQGGYSDRDVYGIDNEGYVVTIEGENVYPYGRTCAALRLTRRAA